MSYIKFIVATILSGIVGMAFSISVYAAEIVGDIPESPSAEMKYIIYLHGSVEEEEGSTGKYESAVEAIAEGSAMVISEVRGDTDPNAYAELLKQKVNKLLSSGVPANNITISGFSKGAIITLATARAIQNPAINYVLLAGCSEELNEKYSVATDNISGRILAIYDSEDEGYGSCSDIIKRSENTRLEEVELDSGKGHKLFRIPKEKFIKQWRDPLLEWAGA